MDTTAAPAYSPAPAPTPALPAWQPRRVARDSSQRLIGGVASGLAEHLGLPVLWVRLAFIVMIALQGLGVATYAALWLMLPSDARFHTDTPGAEAALRQGKRPGRGTRLREAGPVIALAILTLGVVAAVHTLGILHGRYLPLLFVVAGVGLLWRQADEAQQDRWQEGQRSTGLLRTVFGHGWWGVVRLAVGLLLIAASLLVSGPISGEAFAQSAQLIVLLLAGLSLALAPIVFRLVGDYNAERTERVRTQERADLAAHLHDSVLQTLALIQRNAHDRDTVARLARTQERELRQWLYADVDPVSGTFMAALREAAARTEDERSVVVDVVNVGDTDLDDTLRPLVAAASEAITNAAKHAGTGRVDVYAEVTPEAVEVFVRDRGPGFDLDQIAEDRHGVRDSIIDRMQRHGGQATVRTAPGEGTNVQLRMPRS